MRRHTAELTLKMFRARYAATILVDSAGALCKCITGKQACCLLDMIRAKEDTKEYKPKQNTKRKELHK